MRSRVHTSVANPWARAPCSSACSISYKALSGILGWRPVGPRLLQPRGPYGLPAGMPAAGALAREVQLPGDLSLGATLGE